MKVGFKNRLRGMAMGTAIAGKKRRRAAHSKRFAMYFAMRVNFAEVA